MNQPRQSDFSTLVQGEFAHLKTKYFNSAYFGPSPGRSKEYMQRAANRELDPSFYNYNDWMQLPDKLREKIASFMGCPADSIAHLDSVSHAINIVANGFKLNADDEVLLIDNDYPSIILPFLLSEKDGRGRVVFLNSSLPSADEILAKINPKTKIVALSHVSFDTGRMVDLVSIGKALQSKGIFFVVDATQSLGGMRISKDELRYIDVLACACYKWMLGPYGHAFAYFSERAIQEVSHKFGNWITSPNSKNSNDLLKYTTQTRPGARKFDRGQTPNMLTMSCLEAALDFYSELDPKEILSHNNNLRDHFLDHFPKNDFQLVTPKEKMGHILCLKYGHSPSTLKKFMQDKGIDFSIREGNIRLSFHLFNTIEQVDILIQSLEEHKTS